jgi:hypothetical protein
MSEITRDQFLARRTRAAVTKDVEVEGLGTITVRGLRSIERTKWERESAKDPDGARGFLITLCAINGDGTPKFQPEDAKALNEMLSDDTEPLVDGIFELSGMNKAARDAAGKGSAPAAGNETPTS